MYEKKTETNSMSYVKNRRKSKIALAVFLLFLSVMFLSFAHETNSWSLASDNYSSSLTIITGGGVTDTSSGNIFSRS